MSTIDDLLAQSLLLREPHVPADVVPHDEPLDDDLLLWQHRANDTVDDSAAQSLGALCETVVSHCTPDQLADFLTDQIPRPRTARILGCALHLAGIRLRRTTRDHRRRHHQHTRRAPVRTRAIPAHGRLTYGRLTYGR
ncbi:hypothetical protein ACFVP3_38700 [Streptomyces sp. NPDC057806]|uniref:hypothetical protein n=1 Tax=Streptomyces sp. NPDC057806 TaxID=3346255 RepID=UPI00368AB558